MRAVLPTNRDPRVHRLTHHEVLVAPLVADEWLDDGGGLFVQIGPTFKRWVYIHADATGALHRIALGAVTRYDMSQARQWAATMRKRAAAGALDAGVQAHRARRSSNATASNARRASVRLEKE